MTPNEVTIRGSAPYFSSEGTQLVPERNAPKSMPSTKNAERPCVATMMMRVATMIATRATHAPVIPRPTFSSRRFGKSFFAMSNLSRSYIKRGGRRIVRSGAHLEGKRNYLEETVPLASFLTFMSEDGMKPSSSTSLPWTASDIM